jgi:hypothetical protein
MSSKPSFWPFPVHAGQKEAYRRIAKAVRENDPEAVAEAVALGSPVNFLMLGNNRSLLGTALKAKRYAAAEALLAAGASPLYPWDWCKANPADPMAKDGTVVTMATTAVETVVETAQWPWVERFFGDSALGWQKMDELVFSTFSRAVFQRAPSPVMDVMLERARQAKLQRPSDAELLDHALHTGSPAMVQHMALRCQKVGVSDNPHALAPPVLDTQGWANSIQSFLTSDDPEFYPSGPARLPMGRGLVQMVTLWLNEGGDRARVVAWVGLAARIGLGQALSKCLLPACPVPLKDADVEDWICQTLDAPSRASEVWKALDQGLGEHEINRHLERMAISGRLWSVLDARLKSPIGGLGASMIKSLARLGRAGVQLPQGFMEDMLAWRGTGIAPGPIHLMSGSLGPQFLEAMTGLGWNPASSSVAWDELIDASKSPQARAWLRTRQLEHSLAEPSQSRRGPRL